jgi:hypothetical protein
MTTMLACWGWGNGGIVSTVLELDFRLFLFFPGFFPFFFLFLFFDCFCGSQLGFRLLCWLAPIETIFGEGSSFPRLHYSFLALFGERRLFFAKPHLASCVWLCAWLHVTVSETNLELLSLLFFFFFFALFLFFVTCRFL